jgi:hypothetical protein
MHWHTMAPNDVYVAVFKQKEACVIGVKEQDDLQKIVDFKK